MDGVVACTTCLTGYCGHIAAELARLRQETIRQEACNADLLVTLNVLTLKCDSLAAENRQMWGELQRAVEHNYHIANSDPCPYTAREAERVKALESLAEIVGASAPLLWAVKGMEAEANEWEKKAKATLDKVSIVLHHPDLKTLPEWTKADEGGDPYKHIRIELDKAHGPGTVLDIIRMILGRLQGDKTRLKRFVDEA